MKMIEGKRVKVVEYVCTGNHGRSPIAAAIAKAHARELKVEVCIDIRSSGSEVSKFLALDYSASDLLYYVGKALTKGFLTEFKDPGIIAIAKKALDTKGADELALKTIIARMADFEECYRNIVISEMLYPKTSKGIIVVSHIPRQLVISYETDYILAMGGSNKKVAEKIYSERIPRVGGVSIYPTIKTLGEFTGNPTIQIADPFGGTLQEYRDTAEALKPIIKKSVELVVEGNTGILSDNLP